MPNYINSDNARLAITLSGLSVSVGANSGFAGRRGGYAISTAASNHPQARANPLSALSKRRQLPGQCGYSWWARSICDDRPGLGRWRCGRGFTYFDEMGRSPCRLCRVKAAQSPLRWPPALTANLRHNDAIEPEAATRLRTIVNTDPAQWATLSTMQPYRALMD